jgi:hypothetical protein
MQKASEPREATCSPPYPLQGIGLGYLYCTHLAAIFKYLRTLKTKYLAPRGALDSGCIIEVSGEPAKLFIGSPLRSSHNYVFGTPLTLLLAGCFWGAGFCACLGE